MSDHFKGWQDGHLPPPEIPEQEPAEQIKKSGEQVLDIGAIADGELLVRDGTDIVGWSGIVPSARVYNSANISIPNNTVTVLTFNSELLDTDNIHDTATNPSRLTCKTAGLYAIYGNAQFAAHATGARSVLIRLNGTTFIAEAVAGSAGIVQSPPVSTQYPLEVGDYIELAVWQNSGGSLAVNYVDAYTPVFGMTRIGA